MIYSINTLPIVLFYEISKSKNLSLLSDENLGIDKLNEIWENINIDYSEHENSIRTIKIKQLRLKLGKENSKYQVILSALEYLKYGKSEKIINILKDKGYKFTDNLKKDLELISKQVLNLENRIESISNQIIELSKSKKGRDVSIYEIIVNLAVGLEIPIDANKLTTIEFIFYRKALENKIKALR